MIRQAGSEYAKDSFEEHVFASAMNIPLRLNETPTTSGNQLPKHGDWGFDGSHLYLTLSGTTYKITLTAV